MGLEPVDPLADVQRQEFAGRGLRPELGRGDLVDELGVARLGLVAEVDLGRPATFRHGADLDEQEMGAGLGASEHAGRQPPDHPTSRVHAMASAVVRGSGRSSRHYCNRGGGRPSRGLTAGGIFPTILKTSVDETGAGRSPRDRIIDQISPHSLWVGHAGDGADPRRLHDLGIEAVVQVAAEEPPLSPPRGLLYFRFPLLDGSGNRLEVLRLAVGTVAALIRLRVPTLVCCGMGLSRSPALASVALAVVQREPPDDVLRMVAERHPVDVSPAFWREVRAVRAIPIGFEAPETGRSA